MLKRKRERVIDKVKHNYNFKKFKVDSSIKLKYFCTKHDNDKSICSIYECDGTSSNFKEDKNQEDYEMLKLKKNKNKEYLL